MKPFLYHGGGPELRIEALERNLRELRQIVEALVAGSPSFLVGSTTTGAAGSSAEVTLTETSPDVYSFAFTVPRGDTGATGATGAKGDKGDKGDTGAVGPKGDTGDAGSNGWSPIYAIEIIGARRVLRLVDWTGGTGTKPAILAGGLPQYAGPSGFTTNTADAIDIRGEQGEVGPAGSLGAVTGTFVMATGSATSTVVTDTNVTASSKIAFFPANANAFSIDGEVTGYTPASGSFTVTHQASSLTRNYVYLVIN